MGAGYNRKIVIGVVVGAAILLFIYLLWSRKSDAFEMAAVASPAPQPPTGGGPELVLFYSHQCPHCHAIMPTWEQVEQSLLGKIKTRKIESSEPEAARHSVHGVPTIRLFSKGLAFPEEYQEYKGNRSLEDILNFSNSALLTSR
jgi:thiol-disulfide isomerase/thioredoxin